MEQNGNADALSRMPLPGEESEKQQDLVKWTQEATSFNFQQVSSLPINAKAITRETMHDAILARVLHYSQNGRPDVEDITNELKAYHHRRQEITSEVGCLLWGARVVVPAKYRAKILQELHSGHPGIVRMKGLALLHVWWPNIDQNVEVMVQNCESCQFALPMPPKEKGNPWKWP